MAYSMNPDQDKLLVAVQDRCELIGRRAHARLGLSRRGVDPDIFCENLRDRAIGNVLKGKFDPSKGSIEQLMYGIALRLGLESIRKARATRSLFADIDGYSQSTPFVEENSLLAALTDDSPAAAMDRDDRLAIEKICEEIRPRLDVLADEAGNQASEREFNAARASLQRLALYERFLDFGDRDQALFYRKYWCNQKMRDYANELGLEPNALHKRHSRCKERIHDRFEDLCREFGVPPV